MTDDLISRDKLYENMLYAMCGTGYQYVALREIELMPSVDAVPVRHGHWIVEWETEDTRMLRCSKCRMIFNVGKGRDGNYCPECGCRMDEVE